MRILYFIPFLILLFLSILLYFGLTEFKTRNHISSHVGEQLPRTTLIELDSHKEIQSQELRPPFILNFFASWCGSCNHEHLIWLEFSKKNNIPLYGIVWKDKEEEIKEFLTKSKNPYTKVFLDNARELSIDLGVISIPETFIIGKNGTILYHASSPFDPVELSQELHNQLK
jgi:DsbE subfamily thiol:disulfide oxidoreductase